MNNLRIENTASVDQVPCEEVRLHLSAGSDYVLGGALQLR
jgi:hypothetical protein